MLNNLPYFATLAAVLCLAPQPLYAQQIVVDPDGIGATDVVEFVLGFDFERPLTNPLSSPLLLSSSELRVGLSGRGELLIADGAQMAVFGAQNGDGRVTVTGDGSSLVASHDLVVAPVLSGLFESNLDVLDGAMVEADDVFVGLASQGNGTLLVAGLGSELVSRGAELVVGSAGSSGGRGVVRVADGGTISATNLEIGFPASLEASLATVIVEGPESTLTADVITAAGLGERDLVIRAGGSVTTQTLLLGRESGAAQNGSAIVTDGGRLHIEGDFRLTNPDLRFAGGIVSLGGDRHYDGMPSSVGLNAILEPRGGRLSNGETLMIAGELDLLTGLTIDGATLSVGSTTNLAGIDLVRGTLELTATNIEITEGGAFGDTLELHQEQQIGVSQQVAIAGDGRLQLAGGRFDAGFLTNSGLITGFGRVDAPLINRIAGEIRVGPGETLRFAGPTSQNQGDLRLLGGLAEFDGELNNVATGVISGRGVIVTTDELINRGRIMLSGGPTDVIGGVDNRGAIEIAGDSVATFFDEVTSNGDLTINAGSKAVFLDDVALAASSSLSIEVDHADDGVIEVSGDLLLDGTLVPTLAANVEVALGDRFRIATVAGDLSGSIHDLVAPLLPGGLTFRIESTNSSLDLVAVNADLTGLPGDFNNDGLVDSADYAVWRDRFGMPANTLANDINGGLVDGAQYNTWRGNYGAALASVAVPEPASHFVLMSAVTALFVRRRAA